MKTKLLKTAEILIGKKVEKFTDWALVVYNCEAYWIDFSFNGEECFLKIFCTLGGLKTTPLNKNGLVFEKIIEENRELINKKFKVE